MFLPKKWTVLTETVHEKYLWMRVRMCRIFVAKMSSDSWGLATAYISPSYIHRFFPWSIAAVHKLIILLFANKFVFPSAWTHRVTYISWLKLLLFEVNVDPRPADALHRLQCCPCRQPIRLIARCRQTYIQNRAYFLHIFHLRFRYVPIEFKSIIWNVQNIDVFAYFKW
jgi:hypothetical protein